MNIINSIFFIVFIFVFLAELGDKTQMVVIALASKYKSLHVAIGVISSIIVLNIFAVVAGRVLYKFIPISLIHNTASIIFVLLGILLLMQNKDEEISKKSHIKNPILASFILFLLAEFCDKTQLSTMLFAAKYDSTYQVFLGGVLGMILADSLGIVLGFILNKYISPNVFKFVGGLLFVFFGVYGIVTNIPLDRLNPIINTAAILFGIGSLMISILLLKSRNSKKM